MAIDIQKVRSVTPGCQDKLFFDSAGSSLPPNVVVEKMKSYLEEEQLIGGYRLADTRMDILDDFYSEASKLIGGNKKNFAFTYNATDSYARALSSIPFKKGDVVITSNDDYISNQIQFLSLKKRFGVDIVRINNLENGDIDLLDFDDLLTKHNPKLVAVTHIPTGAGQIQNVRAIGELCKDHDCYYLLDACQSVGQIPLNVDDIHCDFLSATGRKFLRGPRGTGFLYLSDRVISEKLEPLFIDMRGADWTGSNTYQLYPGGRRFEMWEFPYAAVSGLKEAIGYANHLGIENIYDYNNVLSQYLRSKLESISSISVMDRGSRKGNIVTIHKSNTSLEKFSDYLIKNELYFSVSKKIYNRIDYTKKNIDWTIRLSPHYFNTKEEVDQLINILEDESSIA